MPPSAAVVVVMAMGTVMVFRGLVILPGLENDAGLLLYVWELLSGGLDEMAGGGGGGVGLDEVL